MTVKSHKLFPDSPREIYTNVPLVQVICQLRFPPILRIEGQVPAEFQERIRVTFPLFERGVNPLASQLPPEMAQLIGQQIAGTSYLFHTEDRTSTVTLNPDFIALSTTKYERWELFRDQLRGPLSAAIEVYQPTFFSRIGLRYTDAIQRSTLGIQDEPWSRLLRPHILGELALPEFEHNLEGANRTIRLRLPDGSGSVAIRHGLGSVRASKELAYLIDLDFFAERRTEIEDAEPTLNHFNAMAGSAFRWCITDTLRRALGPIDLVSPE